MPCRLTDDVHIFDVMGSSSERGLWLLNKSGNDCGNCTVALPSVMAIANVLELRVEAVWLWTEMLIVGVIISCLTPGPLFAVLNTSADAMATTACRNTVAASICRFSSSCVALVVVAFSLCGMAPALAAVDVSKLTEESMLPSASVVLWRDMMLTLEEVVSAEKLVTNESCSCAQAAVVGGGNGEGGPDGGGNTGGGGRSGGC